ncbi:MAG: hypothetical protein NT154_03525 [Verrucomicrobia bacterium]|nr:hypothetical protein [Verrucomicrobiota bacterium]
MTPHFTRLFAAALLTALLCSCGKNSSQPLVDSKAFDAAAPEIKQVWDQTVAAAASNDLGSAITTLRFMSRQDITLPQREAVRNALGVYEAKLREGAKRGDAAAAKTMQELGFGNVAPGK